MRDASFSRLERTSSHIVSGRNMLLRLLVATPSAKDTLLSCRPPWSALLAFCIEGIVHGPPFMLTVRDHSLRGLNRS